MISGNPIHPRSTSPPSLIALLTLGALTSLGASSATPEADALITRLARPAPATVAFREARFSPLLAAPLIVSGELGFTGPERLDRRVLRPYREDTAVRGEFVRVEREGSPPRTFALTRAPELRGMLHTFSALLAGDAAAIRRSFEISVEGEDAAWRLELTPKDARARKRLQRIVVSGGASEPHCFSLLNTDGGASVLLLGETAEADIASDVALATLERRCAAGPTAASPQAAPHR